MDNNEFIKGDILEATKREKGLGYHYIIYLQEFSENDFLGCMITHSSSYDNLPMLNTHFYDIDDKGMHYKVGYQNTYLVKGKFYKPHEWGPFMKVGKLTKVGISFVINELKDCPHESFSEYFRRNKHVHFNEKDSTNYR